MGLITELRYNIYIMCTLGVSKLARVCCLILFLAFSCGNCFLSAQTSRSESRNDTLKFKERLSFRTNAVDWFLLCPNIGVEFDLRAGDFNKWTIGADVVYNWNTWESDISPYVYDIAQVTLEGRKYYRTKRGEAKRDTTLAGVTSWLKYLTRLERKKARTWRAYYWGFYGSATKYSFKLGDVGYQGPAYSLGISFGYGMPLYVMGKGTLDLEIGGRAGMILTKTDAYSVDFESDCYPRVPEKSEGFHLVPYPLITDLHVSLVYRFKSIRNKYRRINYEKEERDMQRQREIELRRDSIRAAKEERQEEMRQQIEVLNKAKKAKKQRQHQADSLGVALDSLPMLPDELKAKELLDNLEQKKLEEQNAENQKKSDRKEKAKQRKAEIAAAKAAKKANKEGRKEDEP